MTEATLAAALTADPPAASESGGPLPAPPAAGPSVPDVIAASLAAAEGAGRAVQTMRAQVASLTATVAAVKGQVR